ncbi:MAG: hypothetical protein KF863_11115 [Rubrivivax sp.]|nr:hypothetical protein [Rubrivivax sp.]
MAPRLYSIEQMPRALPVWDAILHDLGNPPAHRVAQALGVGRSTVYRWSANGGGPRIACLALFWLTRWGRSAVDAQATNDAQMAVQLARALAEERDRLRLQLDALSSARDGLPAAVAVAPLPTAAASAGALAAAGPELRWPELGFPLPELGDLGDAASRAGRVADRLGRGDSAAGRLAAPPVQVLPQRDGEQGIQRDAERLGVAARLGVQRVGEPDIGGHGAILAPSSHHAEARVCVVGTETSPGAGAAAPAAAPLRSACSQLAGPAAAASATASAPRAAQGCSWRAAPAVPGQPPDPRAPGCPGTVAGPVLARAADAGSPLRGLDGRSHGAAPHTPAPRAPGQCYATAERFEDGGPVQPGAPPGAAVFAAIASATTGATFSLTRPRTAR